MSWRTTSHKSQASTDQTSKMPVNLRFSYRIPAGKTIPALLFALGMTAILVYIAQGNQKGLRFYRLIAFSVDEATKFYWGAAAVFLSISVLACVFIVRSFKPPQILILDEHQAILPEWSIRARLSTVPYKKMLNIQILDYRGQKVGVIKSKVGEFRVAPEGFHTTQEFNEFWTVLVSRARDQSRP